jgi:hypothetical protein
MRAQSSPSAKSSRIRIASCVTIREPSSSLAPGRPP